MRQPPAQQAAFGPGRAQSLQKGGAADRVKDHVHAALRAKPVAQIGCVAVDQNIRPGLLRDGQAGLAARRGDHPGPHMLADFHGCQSHPAGGPQDQQRLARLQAGAVIQRQMRGAVSDLERSGLHEAHAIGNGHAARCRDGYKISKPAAARHGGNSCTRRKSGDPGAAGLHRSGNFHAKRERQGRRILIPPLGHEKIGKVQSARRRTHQNLAWPRVRNGNCPQAGRKPEPADL